jgi:hypothetical protein
MAEVGELEHAKGELLGPGGALADRIADKFQ